MQNEHGQQMKEHSNEEIRRERKLMGTWTNENSVGSHSKQENITVDVFILLWLSRWDKVTELGMNVWSSRISGRYHTDRIFKATLHHRVSGTENILSSIEGDVIQNMTLMIMPQIMGNSHTKFELIWKRIYMIFSFYISAAAAANFDKPPTLHGTDL